MEAYINALQRGKVVSIQLVSVPLDTMIGIGYSIYRTSKNNYTVSRRTNVIMYEYTTREGVQLFLKDKVGNVDWKITTHSL